MADSKAEPVTAAGGVVFREGKNHCGTEVLMIFRNDTWDLPKGKLEPPESIAQCAVREVAEEVGCTLPAIVQKAGTTYHEYPEKNKLMGKTTHWYTMILPRGGQHFVPQQKEGITEVRWMPVDEAIEKAGFQNLKDILKAFRDQIMD